MNSAIEYVVLAVVGALSAMAAHRLGKSSFRSLSARFFYRFLIESAALEPGVALAGFFASRRDPKGPFDTLLIAAAYFLPYALARVALVRSSLSQSREREHALPFLHWFALLHSDRAAANEFLAAYIAQYASGDLLSELQRGCASLREHHAEDPLLPLALQTLGDEIRRLAPGRSIR